MADDIATMVRIIRRYSNRKLYDTAESHCDTLGKVAELIRAGEEIRVIVRDTQQDITAATMTQIIFEEEKSVPRLPVEGLRRVIRSGLPMQPSPPLTHHHQQRKEAKSNAQRPPV